MSVSFYFLPSGYNQNISFWCASQWFWKRHLLVRAELVIAAKLVLEKLMMDGGFHRVGIILLVHFLHEQSLNNVSESTGREALEWTYRVLANE